MIQKNPSTRRTAKMLTEQQVIRALRRLSDGWPDDLTLFSWSGTVCLMRTSEMPVHEGDGISCRDAILEQFDGITSDGGDPD